MNKLNGSGQEADEAMFAYLKLRDGPPSASIYNPSSNRQVFDTCEKHSLMIECWRTVFHKHAEAESTWPQFHTAYGQYEPGKPANVEIPNGHDLHARAQRATEKANGGSDGWTPSELKALPPFAWMQRAKLLKLMHEEC